MDTEKRQVIISICCICQTTLGCYDSDRKNGFRKKYCGSCTETTCPSPTKSFSHGFCDSHFVGDLQRRIMEQQKGV